MARVERAVEPPAPRDGTAVNPPARRRSAIARSVILKDFARRLEASPIAPLRQVAEGVYLLARDMPPAAVEPLGIHAHRIPLHDRAASGPIMIVIGSGVAAEVLALNVAACIAAGNSVSIALTAHPGEEQGSLLDIMTSIGIGVANWSVRAAEGRWSAGDADRVLAILTATHVLVENRAPVRFSPNCQKAAARRLLIEIYSRARTVEASASAVSPAAV
jgi:hypothetical protein